MFLLPSLVLGLVLALLLGGKPSRLAEVRLRASPAVLLALLVQITIFSRLGASIPDTLVKPLHLASYGLLLLFALANLRLVALAPVLLGMALNAVVIAANGGRMPISAGAAHAAGVTATSDANVDLGAGHLHFLGDVFALPYEVPFANTFSVGDLLVGFGMIAFIVLASLEHGHALTPGRLLVPLRVPAYRRLAAGKLVSHLGDWITLAALVGWVYAESSSTTQVAAVMLVRLAPPILGSGIAAVAVDRLPKHRLITWIEVARGIAIVGALAGVQQDNLALVFGFFAVSGCLAAMSNTAVPALVPGLLPAEQLAAANAGLGMAKDGAMAIGALTAGIALSVVGVSAALTADIVTFLVAALLFNRLPREERRTDGAGEDDPRGGGFGYLLRRRNLLLLVISFGAATLATGLTNATLPSLLETELGLGPGGYGFGTAALAVGLAVGGAVVGFARVGAAAGRWIGAGLILMAGMLALLGLADHAPTALLLVGFVGLIDGTTDVLFETSVQREADARHYGAVFGVASAFMMTTMMGAVAVAPLVNRLVDARGAILAASIFLVAAGVIALVGIRSPEPEEASGRELQPPGPAVATANGRVRMAYSTESPGLTEPLLMRVPTASPPTGPRARILRPGQDISVVVWGGMTEAARLAAAELAAEELSLELIELETTKPWDLAAVLRSVEKTSRVVIVHDNSGNELLAAEIAATLGERAFQHLDAPITRIPAERDIAEQVRELASF